MEGNGRIREIADLEPGDHLCCLFESEEDRRVVIIPFILQGLEANHKILYILDPDAASEFLHALRDEGLDIESHVTSGQLVLLELEEAYMKGRVFDPDGMVAMLEGETKKALSEGFSALRVTAEMSWALMGFPGSDRLIEYEAKLNLFFPGSRCMAICQYDRKLFGPEVLLEVLKTHPTIVIGTEIYDNFYYLPPYEYSERDVSEATLKRWIGNLAARKASDIVLQKSRRDLEERVKELDCLYGIARIIEEPDLTLEEIIQRAVGIIPPAFSYPEIACARIFLYEREHSSCKLSATEWRLASGISVRGKKAGIIEVFYTEQRPDLDEGPFLKEERHLIDAIAERLGRVVERKTAETALAESEERFRSIVEQSSDGIVLVNQDGVIVEWNLAQEEIVGIGRERALGRYLWDIQYILAPEEMRSEENYRNLRSFVLAFLHDGRNPWSGEVHEREIRSPEGKRKVIQTVIFPIQMEGGFVMGSIIRDVTGQKLAEEELQRINQELEAYAHIVSHDLRGPISVVISASDTLSDLVPKYCDDSAAGKIMEIASIIKRSSSNAEQLANDLLGLARAGQAPREVLEVDVGETVDRILEEQLNMGGEAMIKVIRDEDLGRIKADPTQIYQLFSNLIRNAINFNDNPKPQIELRYQEVEEGLHGYRVRDNGPGIAVEDKERIFMPLFRGSQGGTGIGLATVKKIVAVYGGDIQVENDGGASFEFILRDFDRASDMSP